MKLHKYGVKKLLKNKTVFVNDLLMAMEFSDAKNEISDTLKEMLKECSKYQKMLVIADCGEDNGIVAYRCNYTDAEIVFEIERLKMRTLAIEDNDCEECGE